jgi:catechol 2,3-dioxygenase-like lactoylglutathione lyase family enzyme
MGFHHVAFATRDLPGTHRFYTEVMGFALAKVVAAKSPEGGWAKHVFYGLPGGDLIAFWDLHDIPVREDWSPAISTGMGLPAWVNHIAFRAEDLGEIERRKRRWLEAGHDVMEVDHGFCVSVYTVDPNGILVEWCADARPLDESDRAEAERLLADPHPPLESGATAVFHKAPAR